MNHLPVAAPDLPLRNWLAAEGFAAWHMAHMLGFTDAAPTPPGADGGLDAVARDAGGQVKHHAQPVGRPDLQRLRGACLPERVPVFYALSGYTVGALAFAEATAMALFVYTVTGDCKPASTGARDLLAHADERSAAIAERRRQLQEMREAHAAAQEQVRQAWERAVEARPDTMRGMRAHLGELEALALSRTLEKLIDVEQWQVLGGLLEGPVREAFHSARLAHARAVQLKSGVMLAHDASGYASRTGRRALEVLDEMAGMCRAPEPDGEVLLRLIEANGRRWQALLLEARRALT